MAAEHSPCALQSSARCQAAAPEFGATLQFRVQLSSTSLLPTLLASQIETALRTVLGASVPATIRVTVSLGELRAQGTDVLAVLSDTNLGPLDPDDHDEEANSDPANAAARRLAALANDTGTSAPLAVALASATSRTAFLDPTVAAVVLLRGQDGSATGIDAAVRCASGHISTAAACSNAPPPPPSAPALSTEEQVIGQVLASLVAFAIAGSLFVAACVCCWRAVRAEPAVVVASDVNMGAITNARDMQPMAIGTASDANAPGTSSDDETSKSPTATSEYEMVRVPIEFDLDERRSTL